MKPSLVKQHFVAMRYNPQRKATELSHYEQNDGDYLPKYPADAETVRQMEHLLLCPLLLTAQNVVRLRAGPINGQYRQTGRAASLQQQHNQLHGEIAVFCGLSRTLSSASTFD